MIEGKLLRVDEVSRALSLGRSKTYELLRSEIPVVKIGRSVRVPAAALERWIAERTAEAEAAVGV